MNSTSSKSRPRSPRLLWSFAGLTMAALVLCVAVITVLIVRDWRDEQDSVLIQDLLWLEQSIRISLDSEREWAANLAETLASVEQPAMHLKAAAGLFLREHPGVVDITLLSSESVRAAVAGVGPGDAVWRVQRLKHAAYGQPYVGADGRYRFDLVVPQAGKGGALRLSYQLDRLLQSQVPWWMASRYHLSVVDVGGRVLASKFTQAEPADTFSHQLSFDPPGFGLSLRAVAYRQGMGVAMPVLLAVIALLTLGLGGAFWRIRRHTGERLRAERALSAEVSLRQAMEDGMKNGLLVCDPAGVVVYVNRAFCQMVGQDAAALVGQATPYPFVEAGGTLDWAAISPDALPEHGLELTLRAQSGAQVEVRVYITPLGDGQGGQRGWIASMYDITELKRQRLAVAASRARFLAVLNGLETGVCVTADGLDAVLYENPAFGRLWPAHAPLPGLPPAEGEEGVPFDHGPDGSGRVVELRHNRIEWSDGERAWLTLLLDVSEARQREERERTLEQRFQDTTRLVAMGEMASSLAHELGQPLTAITTYAGGLKRRLGRVESLPDGVLPALQGLSEQAKRAAQIVASIRAFVKKHSPQVEPVDPVPLMQRALALVQPLADKHLVPLRLVQRGRACRLQADPVLIEQVVLNLVKNAIEAQVDAGVTRPRVDVRSEAGAESWRVEVVDNGPGLSDSARANLFTPFYSSKADGMGIGLNICRSIVEFHRGEFGVTRTLSGGCVFWFTLPLDAEGVPA